MKESFSVRRFVVTVIAFVGVLGVGTVGFHALTDDSWVGSLYRAVVTTTLTGLDRRPEGSGAQIFSLFVLFVGVAIFLYLAGVLVEMIARGVLTDVWAERRRRLMIEHLTDHYIICGYGRVGRRIGDEFRQAGVHYVVVDFNAEAVSAARERGELLVEGSGTNDEHLAAAGLARARGLVASSDSDENNLYITLSARAARPDLLIVARASNEDAVKKLRRAGADRVVQPYSTAGQEMAKLVLKPQVAAFLEMLMTHGGPELSFEEIEVRDGCGHVGRTIRDLRIRHDTGALVVGLRRGDGSFAPTPSPDTVLEDGDVLIAVGADPELRALEEMFAAREAVAG